MYLRLFMDCSTSDRIARFVLKLDAPIRELGKVPRRLPFLVETQEPGVLSGANGVEVDHEEDSGGIALGIETEKELAELERCAVARSGTDGYEVPK